MIFRLIVASLLPTLILGVQVLTCPDHLPIHAPPIDLQIDGCDAQPCHINRGDSVSMQTRFRAAVYTDEMRLALNSTVFGVQRPVELPYEMQNACNVIDGNCPVNQGDILTLRATIPVETEVHGGVPVELKLYVSHAPGFYCTCVLVNVVIH
ncbi:hypothetical protein Bhyg_15822 [Pseudolycoriella hygida]|uniref:MD-2-related lipid-recognition domain-containing protein n=1 Tax=Pseudolycoriella hygida TaxID=35572 RepID=A0A9Q0MKC9_9DIPT|nr:hypothetical protein Bhyg_15822 [Pseudolycoriella hygida]